MNIWIWNSREARGRVYTKHFSAASYFVLYQLKVHENCGQLHQYDIAGRLKNWDHLCQHDLVICSRKLCPEKIKPQVDRQLHCSLQEITANQFIWDNSLPYQTMVCLSRLTSRLSPHYVHQPWSVISQTCPISISPHFEIPAIIPLSPDLPNSM